MNFKDDIKSAFIHKNIVNKIYNSDFSNKSTLNVVYEIESFIKNECKDEVINNGIAFPVNVCLNECIAHNTPLNHDQIIKEGDLLKIDFGVHINGYITDSAFTIPVNTYKFNELINISKRATTIGVEQCGPDALLSDIGEHIEEYILSKEVEINGTFISVKNIKDLCGHSITPYIVHSGKAVPNCKIDFNYPLRMVVGEKYAIEPFVTTGTGVCIYDNENVNHFMLKPNYYYNYNKNKSQLNENQKTLYNQINAYYKSLPFTHRWILENSKSNYNNSSILMNDLNILHKQDIIEKYPPIYDVKGSYVAHHEHNVIITDKGKMWLTKNNHY
jgi:methionyl aminopeptidase